MPKNPKLFMNNVPVEICTSVQNGLPFVTTLYMELLLKGILAAAQTMFPVTICHFVIMANHIHLLIIVQDPNDVPRFMDYFKTETAIALNILKGTTGQSFWVSGYDSPSILSPEKFLERMLYLYLNPVEASLVPSIAMYPGVSTYNALLNGDTKEQFKKISRDAFTELPVGNLSDTFTAELAESYLDARGVINELRVEPWAWLNCYRECKNWKLEEVRERFLRTLNSEQQRVVAEKVQKKETFLGVEKLKSQQIRAPYHSKRSGKKMICLSGCAKQRDRMIEKFKELTKLARSSYQLRKAGFSSAAPPPGFFLPGGMLLANIVFPSLFIT